MAKLTTSAKQVMIRAKYAWSGKSYVCERLAVIGMRVLFVCPTNKLLVVQTCGTEASTVNNFSIAVGDEKLEKWIIQVMTFYGTLQ